MHTTVTEMKLDMDLDEIPQCKNKNMTGGSSTVLIGNQPDAGTWLLLPQFLCLNSTSGSCSRILLDNFL